MSEQIKSEDEKESRSWPLWLGGIGSAIWLLIVLAYALSSNENGHWRAHEFWHSLPNNFGDTLAGVFAPLAFLWLVVATLLQKHELEQNRQALLLQARELQNSVEQLTVQTEIHRKNALSTDNERTLAQARANYESLVKRVFWLLESLTGSMNIGPSSINFPGKDILDSLFRDGNTERAVAHFIKQHDHYKDQAPNLRPGYLKYFESRRERLERHTAIFLEQYHDLRSMIAGWNLIDLEVQMENDRIGEFKERLEQLRDWMRNDEK